MALKDNIKQYFEKLERRETFEGRMNRRGHFAAYHRHFEGYTEYTVPTGDGSKTKIERKYVGSFYVSGLSAAGKAGRCFLYVFLLCAAFAAVIPVGTMELPTNQSRLTGLLLVLLLLCTGWEIVSLLIYMVGGLKLTIGDYKSASLGIRRSSFCSALCLLLITLWTAVGTVMGAQTLTSGLLCAAGYFVGAALLFMQGMLERNLKYTIIENTETVPHDGIIIE